MSPRPSPQPFDPTFIIAGVGLIIVLLFGALLNAFVQTVHSSAPAVVSRGKLVELAEQAFRDGDDQSAARIFSELADKNNATAETGWPT